MRWEWTLSGYTLHLAGVEWYAGCVWRRVGGWVWQCASVRDMGDAVTMFGAMSALLRAVGGGGK